jgi:cytoskeletal protein RodZ
MKTAITGLMLGMLAVGGLIAVGALNNGQAFAQISPSNTATAANAVNQPVTQSNSASISQESKTKCKASVSDDDVAQVGDNVNTAANDCDTTQTATVGQANVNTQTTTQNALALACQSLGGLATNFCGNSGEDEEI